MVKIVIMRWISLATLVCFLGLSVHLGLDHGLPPIGEPRSASECSHSHHHNSCGPSQHSHQGCNHPGPEEPHNRCTSDHVVTLTADKRFETPGSTVGFTVFLCGESAGLPRVVTPLSDYLPVPSKQIPAPDGWMTLPLLL